MIQKQRSAFMHLNKRVSTSFFLFIFSLVFLSASFLFASGNRENAPRKKSRPEYSKNIYSKTTEVVYNLETSKITNISVRTQSGDIICKSVKKVPAPKHLSNKVAQNDDLINIQVKIKYTVWTQSEEKATKLTNNLAKENPAQLSDGILTVNTNYASATIGRTQTDEYCADIEILTPKDVSINWDAKTSDGSVETPN